VSVNVVLDAPGERSSMQTFYEKELADKGWSPLPPGPQAHGFQFGSQPSRPSIFCSPQGNSWLSMGVNAGRDGTNDVRISTNGQIPNPCQRPAQPSPGPLSANSPIPALYAPEGVTMQPGGSGGGPVRWSSEATATTDQKAGPLKAHFAPQLQSAKWTRLDGRDDGALAWSTWKLPDGDWQGLLYVLNGPGQNRRVLHVDAQSATAQQGSGSQAAFAGGQAVAILAPAPPEFGPPPPSLTPMAPAAKPAAPAAKPAAASAG